MSDNGAAMLAAEVTEGLARLGILHETTLAYSPYQKASLGLRKDTDAAKDGRCAAGSCANSRKTVT